MKKPQLKVRIVHLLGIAGPSVQSAMSKVLNASRPAIRAAVAGLLRDKLIEVYKQGTNGHIETTYCLSYQVF